jgi:hypothetical protein
MHISIKLFNYMHLLFSKPKDNVCCVGYMCVSSEVKKYVIWELPWVRINFMYASMNKQNLFQFSKLKIYVRSSLKSWSSYIQLNYSNFSTERINFVGISDDVSTVWVIISVPSVFRCYRYYCYILAWFANVMNSYES